MKITISKHPRSRRNLFEVSGPPGSGKTTFLEIIKELTGKKCLSVDPRYFLSFPDIEGVEVLFVENAFEADVNAFKQVLASDILRLDRKHEPEKLVANKVEYIFFTRAKGSRRGMRFRFPSIFLEILDLHQ